MHVFSYDIFESLKAINPGVGGEYQLTDAVRHMLQSGKRVFAYKLQGKRYDIGNIRGLLKTTVTLGLHNPLYRDMLCKIFKQEIN
jgi:UTP--glucose-1-phosphate uridylyltransferase